MSEHLTGEELGMATGGSMLTEEEARGMTKTEEVDFPMPGEVSEQHEHSHAMPENATFVDEDGNKVA